MGASILHRRESCTTSTHRFVLVELAVTQGGDWSGLVRASILPEVMGPSWSVHRAVRWSFNGSSGFRGSLFFFLLLAVAGFNSFPLLACLPSVCTCGGVFDGLAVSPLQTALGTSYLTPPHPLWCCSAFSPLLAAQPPAAGCPPPGHTFCRQVCCLSLRQEKGTACSLRSALQPLRSGALSGQRHWPVLG